ncbi:MAG: MBL fold metallo-hydrolase [Candidatus Aminicenantes bacterium]|nr:MAG: MBL fold metallo-hydrolase [Candidatus Aminicenantes bacterium]
MRKHTHFQRLLFIALILPFFIFPSDIKSQQDFAITVEKVAGELYCLNVGSVNVTVLKGNDGLLIVDSSYARTANPLMEEIAKLSPQKIQYLLITHYHGDHTGGNAIIGKDAQIVSHENCKKTMVANLKPEETEEGIGIPQKTFTADLALPFEDENVKLIHFGPAHTSGDTVVIFEKAKVIVAGDLFFHGMPPYIDVNNGSDTKNWVALIEILCEKYPDFKVIPGHGKVTNTAEYLQFARYLKYLRKEVASAIEAGKTRQQAQESIDFSGFSAIQDQGEFLTKKENVGWVYDEMTRKQK